jgi:BatD DUF11 like domain
MNKALVFAAFYFGLVGLAFAEPSVTGSLSEPVTDVDHPVQLEIKVENARITRPPTVLVDGLSISFAGTTSRTQILNLQASTITTFTYIIMPVREGVYEIPPVEISAGGKTFRTAPLTLRVIHGITRHSANSDKPYFAELVIPKESAYVGEQIPIELRFYFTQRVQYQPYPQGQFPIIDGEDFVTKKYSEPLEKQLELDGRIYRVVIYRTALTGVKPGKLELRSATQGFLISTPFGSRNSQGLADPFESFQQQVVDLKTNGSSIQIKPLPAADRPADFSGAVGEFTLTTSAQPDKVNIGDPVNLKVEIKGFGNFDRMEQPTFTGTNGWRIYQPTEGTEPFDDLGLSATKTFSYLLVPEKQVTALPIARFCYFNPNSEKYVVVSSLPASIEVKGEQLPKEPVPAPTASASATSQVKSLPVPDVLDIEVHPSVAATFTPLIKQRTFWIAQTIPACALLILGLRLLVRRSRIASQPIRALNLERRALRKIVTVSNNRSDVLQAAVRILELNCKARNLRKKASPLSFEECINGQQLPRDFQIELHDLIDAKSARIYGHCGPESITEPERRHIITLLNRWGRGA